MSTDYIEDEEKSWQDAMDFIMFHYEDEIRWAKNGFKDHPESGYEQGWDTGHAAAIINVLDLLDRNI
ncbi:MAG TPA: hypothetical protein VKR58_06190 [Aquella sp.]|nr:hypothetical protein [Aquella sp.]